MTPPPRDSPADWVVFVGHDASRTGAPLVLLDLVRWLMRNTDLRCRVVLRKGGPLRRQFAEVAPTAVVHERSGPRRGSPPRRFAELLLQAVAWRPGFWLLRANLRRRGVAVLYVNTVASADLALQLRSLAPLVVHVHELEDTIRTGIGHEHVGALLGAADVILAASGAVRDNLVARHAVDPDRIEVVHGFIAGRGIHDAARAADLRAAAGIPPAATVVGGSGTLDDRKGTDLFVELAAQTRRRHPDVHFLWIGGEPDDVARYDDIARRSGVGDRVHFVGSHANAASLFSAFDVFALVSREDPFPLVMLEAAAHGVPTVCFAGTGGAAEFVADGRGIAVPHLDVGAMAGAVAGLVEDPTRRAELGAAARARVEAEHVTGAGASKVLAILRRYVDADVIRPQRR